MGNRSIIKRKNTTNMHNFLQYLHRYQIMVTPKFTSVHKWIQNGKKKLVFIGISKYTCLTRTKYPNKMARWVQVPVIKFILVSLWCYKNMWGLIFWMEVPRTKLCRIEVPLVITREIFQIISNGSTVIVKYKVVSKNIFSFKTFIKTVANLI